MVLSEVLAREVRRFSDSFATGRHRLVPPARAGGLVAQILIERRYSNVPPEAFPVLETGCDGCYYALFIDDLAQTWTPPVVLVSPMDSDLLSFVAPDAKSFVSLLERGVWQSYVDDPVREELRARAGTARAGSVTHSTRDRLGVVAADHELGAALALARDRLQMGDSDPIALAGAYRALGREVHARVAEQSC